MSDESLNVPQPDKPVKAAKPAVKTQGTGSDVPKNLTNHRNGVTAVSPLLSIILKDGSEVAGYFVKFIRQLQPIGRALIKKGTAYFETEAGVILENVITWSIKKL